MLQSSAESKPSYENSSDLIEAILEHAACGPEVAHAARAAASMLQPRDVALRARIRMRVIGAFLKEGLAESDLAGTLGYGYDDAAREHYEALLARIFRGERALARLNFASGTHAILTALSACTAPGETIVCAAGRPYDTLHYALTSAPNSLASQGIGYAEVALDGNGRFEPGALAEVLATTPARTIFVQRSRGYNPRPSMSIAEIEELVHVVRSFSPNARIIVDNCYGEFVEEREPLEVGADAIAGSLIKNIGGGLAPAGGYVIGRKDVIERTAARLYAPGLRDALGSTLGFGRALLQGLFSAPALVGESLRGLDFAATLFSELGFEVEPRGGEPRTDMVQAITLGTPEALIAFARGLQRVLPVNARFAPEPGAVPGYVDPVIMSSGAFIAGSTAELSCDAPLRPPFQVYLQGGTLAEHVALGAIAAADAVMKGQKGEQR
ncbi:MAG TPA: methionine gamma-lyase family protein [Candidatus Baltobacteraceae bacterium]